MEEKSLEKALAIYSALITGKNVSKQNKETRELYNDFYSDSEVYDITVKLLKSLNLNLYEYNDSIFISAGDGNKVFGYTNDDLKRAMGFKVNRELFLFYFIVYQALLYFYTDSSTYQIKEYIKLDEMIALVTEAATRIAKEDEIFEKNLEASKETFRNVCLLWHELPTATSEDKDRNKASRGSKLGFVKLSFNFLQEQKLFNVVEERFYPTDRFRAIAENYFEEYKGKIFTILGGTDNA